MILEFCKKADGDVAFLGVMQNSWQPIRDEVGSSGRIQAQSSERLAKIRCDFSDRDENEIAGIKMRMGWIEKQSRIGLRFSRHCFPEQIRDIVFDLLVREHAGRMDGDIPFDSLTGFARLDFGLRVDSGKTIPARM